MFFEFSSRKLAVTTLVVLILGSIVPISIFLWQANLPVEQRIAERFFRERANFSYWFWFKLPDETKAALAAAGLPFSSLGTARAEAAGTAKNIPVLLYHGEGAGATTMPIGVFVDQMRALKNAGWRTVTLEQFEAYMKHGTPLPDKSFLLTYDDGRTDTFYFSDPVLKDLGYTAVMFVITGLSLPNNGDVPENSFYLSKSELAYMSQSGRWELQSHGDQDHLTFSVPVSATTTDGTLTPGEHFMSNLFWLPGAHRVETPAEFTARITGDLAGAKNYLEADFGKKVIAYAYPFNDFGEDTVNFPGSMPIIEQVVRSLYTFAFYQTWPGNGDSFNYPDPNQYFIKRIEPKDWWSGQYLLTVLDGGRVKPLPYQSSDFGVDWHRDWGILSGGKELSLTASSTTTGAATLLDGTESWGDYTMRALAKVENGTLSLTARHTENDSPYPVCAFSNDRIYLERHSGQSQETVAKAPYFPPVLPARMNVMMSVRGSFVSCNAYGVTVQANVPNIPAKGGVGLSIWDPSPGTARAVLERFSVTAP